jgi:DNA alkylation repair enzyme
VPATRKPNSIVYTKAVRALRSHSNPERARVYRWYFKDPGQDAFLGVSTRDMRRVAREFRELPMPDVRRLMRSRVHEERSLAHAILRWKFERGGEAEREKIFRFYLRHRGTIHSWDGVDDSAPYIVGPWLLDRDKSLLYQLAQSARLWDRRIAMVSTLHFIRHGRLTDTLKSSGSPAPRPGGPHPQGLRLDAARSWQERPCRAQALPTPPLQKHAADDAAICD